MSSGSIFASSSGKKNDGNLERKVAMKAKLMKKTNSKVVRLGLGLYFWVTGVVFTVKFI
jgi:hypothetical protein